MSLVAGMAMLFVIAITVGGALLLYLIVRAEHDDRSVMDRTTAERTARRDQDDRSR